MEHTFQEISSLLKDGHITGKEKVYLEVFDLILNCTLLEQAKPYFTEEFLSLILNFSGSDSSYSEIIYRILVNIFSEDDISEKLCGSEIVLANTVNLSLRDIVNKNSSHADLGCMLLCNITRSQSNCERISALLPSLSETLHQIVSAFTTIGYNPKCSLDHLAMVLCNFSQLRDIRTFFTHTNQSVLQKLVPFTSHESETRRRGIIGVVHNCAFDSSVHKWMLSDNVDVLPRLLLPLAGPEQFDDEDNDKLPVELQYLPDTKTRDPNPEIRKLLLETLNQLCATRFGRQHLREHNAYIILRELHKWERDSSVLLACENVVDILIRTEDEIGVDQLNTVEIPSDLEDKFSSLMN